MSPPFLFRLCLLLFLYEALLWRENLQEKSEGGLQLLCNRGHIRKGGKLKLYVGQHGWSQSPLSEDGV